MMGGVGFGRMPDAICQAGPGPLPAVFLACLPSWGGRSSSTVQGKREPPCSSPVRAKKPQRTFVWVSVVSRGPFLALHGLPWMEGDGCWIRAREGRPGVGGVDAQALPQLCRAAQLQQLLLERILRRPKPCVICLFWSLR